MSAKLKAKLPENHGIGERHGRSGEHLIAIVGLDPHSVTHFEDGSDPAFTFEIAYVEVADDTDAATLAGMRARIYAQRTGQTPLPLDGEP